MSNGYVRCVKFKWPGVLGPEYAAIAVVGMVLAAMYLLIMVGKVVFGSLKEPEQHEEDNSLPADLSPREIGILVPLAVLCLWIGVQPTLFTNAIQGSVENVLSPYPRIVQQEQEQKQQSQGQIILKGDQHG